MTEVTGVRPLGYRAPSWNHSPNTLDILREMGFLYDSSLMADDRPYEIDAHGEPTGMVELPVEWILDDAPLFNPRGDSYSHPRDVLQVWKDDFDGAYAEGTMFLLTMHPHVIGHRSRIVEPVPHHPVHQGHMKACGSSTTPGGGPVCEGRRLGIGPDTPDGDSDRAALMKLYDAIPTDRAGRSQAYGTWGTDAPLRTWHGVATDGTGRVLSLDLSGTQGANGLWLRHGLVGPIPPELGDLTRLTRLVLEGNELTGPIPPELGNLPGPWTTGPRRQQPDRPDPPRTRQSLRTDGPRPVGQ